jgi:hypothetical protein
MWIFLCRQPSPLFDNRFLQKPLISGIYRHLSRSCPENTQTFIPIIHIIHIPKVQNYPEKETILF